MQNNRTKKMAYAAILSAVSVVVMLIGRFIPTLDLTVCAVASLTVLIACIELGYGFATLTYASTAILSLLLTSGTPVGIYYLFLFGCYPIVKFLAQRLPKWWAWIVKFLFCNAMLGIVVLLLNLFFDLFSAIPYGKWYWVALWALCNFIFFLYDVALGRLVRFYFWRFHKFFPKL